MGAESQRSVLDGLEISSHIRLWDRKRRPGDREVFFTMPATIASQIESLTFTVAEQHRGRRVDRVVLDDIPAIGSRRRARELFARGAVKVNGRVVRKAYIVRAGDVIDVDLSSVYERIAVPNAELPVQVKLEREDVLVVVKPAGQPTVAVDSSRADSLASALLGHYPELALVGGDPREAGLVHRLDTFTSGLLVCARTQSARQGLEKAVKAGDLKKQYQLVCRGDGLPEEGVVRWPIASHPTNSRRVVACVSDEQVRRLRPKAALTTFRVLRRVGAWALVLAEASPATRHQVRVHFASMGAPLLGDVLYGGAPTKTPGHALHAMRIQWRGDAIVARFDVSESGEERLLGMLDDLS